MPRNDNKYEYDLVNTDGYNLLFEEGKYVTFLIFGAVNVGPWASQYACNRNVQ